LSGKRLVNAMTARSKDPGARAAVTATNGGAIAAAAARFGRPAEREHPALDPFGRAAEDAEFQR